MKKQKETSSFQEFLVSLSGAKLLVFFVALSLVITVGIFYIDFLDFQRNQLAFANRISRQIDQYLSEADQTIKYIAEIPNTLESTNTLNTYVSLSPSLSSVMILDSSGKIIQSSPDSRIVSNEEELGKTFFQQAYSSLESGLFLLEEAPSSLGKSAIYIISSTTDGYLIAGELNLEGLRKSIENEAWPDNVVVLTDRNNTLYSTSNSSSAIVLPHLILTEETPFSSRISITDGHVRLVSIHQSQLTNWKTILLTPLSTIIRPYIPAITILALIVGIWIFWAYHIRRDLSKHVIAPLLTLNTYINSLIQGDRSKPHLITDFSSRLLEVKELAQNTDRLSKAIQFRQDQIDDTEQKYRTLVEQSNDAICLQVNGQFEIVNKKFSEMFGIYQETILISDLDFICMVAPRSRIFVKEKQQELLSGTVTNQRYEFTALDKNGQEIEVEVAASAFTYQGSKAIQAILRDITERKKAERSERDQRVLAEALRDTAATLNSTLDFDEVLERILSNVGKVVPHDSSHIMLIDKDNDTVRILAARGYQEHGLQDWLQKAVLSIKRTPALNEMYQTRRPLAVPDTSHNPRWINLPATKWIMSYAGAPIKVKDHVIGFLNLNSPQANFFNQEMAERLQAFADQAGIALHNARLLQELQLAYDSTLQGWSKALELRDYETEGHSQRVADLTMRLAKRMNIREPMLTNIRYGVLLHDIGKIGIPDGILFKPGPLTDDEWETMRKHPEYAYQILAHIPYLSEAVDIPYCHHEKWDGTGYPRGLRGEEIPLGARMFAIVDVWDGLRSKRPYHDGWPEEMVIHYLQEQAGKHFDPTIVELFLEIVKEDIRSRTAEV